MAVNPNWHRWIYASVADHLHAAAAAAGLPLVVEMLDTRSPTWETATSKAEAVISGPITAEKSKGLYLVVVDVFVIITSDRTSNDYDHIDHAGAIANALDQCILVKDYGATGLVDVGELRPMNTESVDVIHLKPTAKDTQVHSTVGVRHLGYFTE